ncbi:hypothetical protein [Acidobacterium sp. S8]|uniref:hypothetical protein n=1 Tax=Acidobacterium sp. S8 TaxID=1641854 RepID=UPI0020B15194|nr:hypothetical protein [Acidobacterium sp. S8]
MSSARNLQDGTSMNCAEFQEKLPELFESGANVSQEEHVQGCETCSALVRDLEYIAAQAKLLLPIHDPSPVVWDNIQSAIRSDHGADSKTAVHSGKRT